MTYFYPIKHRPFSGRVSVIRTPLGSAEYEHMFWPLQSPSFGDGEQQKNLCHCVRQQSAHPTCLPVRVRATPSWLQVRERWRYALDKILFTFALRFMVNLVQPKLHVFGLGRKPDNPEEPRQTKQTLNTEAFQSESTNHCTTVPPALTSLQPELKE